MTNATATEATKEAAKERDYAMVAISIPLDLEETLQERAKAENISHTVLARRVIANAFDYDIVSFERSRRRGRVSGLTPEERAAANAKAQAERAATIRLLMKKYKGELSEEEIEAEMNAAPKRERKAKSEPKTAAKAN